MRLPDDTTKYSHKFRFYEAGTWVPELKSVIRLGKGKKGNRTPFFYTLDELEELANKHERTGIYTSIYAYDTKDINTATRFSSLFFDIDNEEDLDQSLIECNRIVGFFSEIIDQDAIRVYFSGSKGFHVEIEALALGVSPSTSLKKVFRRIAETLRDDLELMSLDFSVYDDRRMWRMPNTIHQKTGLYKREMPKEVLNKNGAATFIKQAARTPNLDTNVPEQRLSPKAAAWYRKFVYAIEKEEQQKDLPFSERLRLFNNQGSGIIHKFRDDDMEFTPLEGLSSCPSILRLWQKAEETGDLDHEERLFLCSLLTYSDEAIEYLLAILKNCRDFSEDRSRHHIEDWIARREAGIGGRPYTCKTARDRGIGCHDCDLEPRPKYARVGDALVETGETADPSPVRLLYKRKRD